MRLPPPPRTHTSDPFANAIAAMEKIPISPDESDGSNRLLAYCRQCRRHGHGEAETIKLVGLMGIKFPFPREWTPKQIGARWRAAKVETGEAYDESDDPPWEPKKNGTHTESPTAKKKIDERFLPGGRVLLDAMLAIDNNVSEVVFNCGPDLEGFEVGPEKVTIVGAPPGTGKTSLANQAAFAALERHTGLRLVIANAEMTPRVLINRELCRRAMVNYQALRFATYTAEEKERLQDAGGQLSALMERTELMVGPYSAADLGAGLSEREPGIVIVDYLQKFKPPGVATMEGIESVMDHLRAYAEAGWAVIALSATKRAEGGKHDSAKLDQAAFRGSSEIEFQADAAYVLRDQSGGAEGDRDMILDCVKNRHGNRGSINLRFVAAEMRFESTVQPFDFGSDF